MLWQESLYSMSNVKLVKSMLIVITLERDATHSAVVPQYVVYPFICLSSVRDLQVA